LRSFFSATPPSETETLRFMASRKIKRDRPAKTVRTILSVPEPLYARERISRNRRSRTSMPRGMMNDRRMRYVPSDMINPFW